jgi:hypothetical protein
MALHGDSFASTHEFEYVQQKKTYSSFANASTHSMANFCYPQTLCWQQGGRAAHGNVPAKRPGTDMAFFNIYLHLMLDYLFVFLNMTNTLVV